MNCHPYCRYEIQAEGTEVEFALLNAFLLTEVHVYILHFMAILAVDALQWWQNCTYIIL